MLSNSERVFGIGETNASFDRVGERIAVEIVKRLRGTHDIVKLDETHGSICFCSETHSLVSVALGEQHSQFLFVRIGRQISDVQRVARGILISGVR